MYKRQATHRSTNTPQRLFEEIVTSKKELETNLGIPIYSWVQPSANYDGLNNGPSAHEYADTLAGQLIAGHHAVYTGVISPNPDQSFHMTGQPMNGYTRCWMDGKTQAAKESIIRGLYGTNRGIILGSHANMIDADGKWTMAEFVAFMEWLKAEQDAGRIKLLFLHEFAYATTSNR